MKKIVLSSLLICCIILNYSCEDENNIPNYSKETLYSSSDTLTIEDHVLTLDSFLFRNLMPGYDENRSKLHCLTKLIEINEDSILFQYSMNYVWIYYGFEMWESELSDEDSQTYDVNKIEGRASNGPRWGPNVYVDVFVEISDLYGHDYLLKDLEIVIGASH